MFAQNMFSSLADWFTPDNQTTIESNGQVKTKLQWKVADFRQLAARQVGYHTTKSVAVRAPEKYDFTLCLYPHGYSERSKDYVSLWLRKDNQKEMVVRFTCSISVDGVEDTCKKTVRGQLALDSVLGWTTFCHRRVILDGDSRILKEQCLILNVDLDVFDPDSIPNPENQDVDPGYVRCLTELSDDYRQLFEDGRLSDFVLKVEDEAFDVHKAVLGARSRVLRTMVQSSLSESKGTMDIEDVSSEAMAKVLRYMYSGRLDSLSVAMAREVFYAADKYELSSLRDLCSRVLADNLEVDNAIDALLLADRHGDSDLLVKCLSFMDKNLREIKKLPKWLELMKNYPRLADKAIFFQELIETIK